MKHRSIAIADINVGTRYRKEKGDISGLVTSIKEKGFLVPVIVDVNNNLVAGERRLMAATEAGLKKVPATEVDVDEISLREIELLENTERKEMAWHERAELEKEIMRLRKEKEPNWTVAQQAEYLNQSIGSTQRRMQLAEVMAVVPELTDAKSEKEAWKKYKRLEEEVVLASMRGKENDTAYKEAVNFAKDHYKIGDALKGLKKVNPETVDFCEVDPPYGIDLHKKKDRNIDLKKLDRYNEIHATEYAEFLDTTTKLVYRVMKDNTFVIWWYGPIWYTHVYTALMHAGFSVNNVPAIWLKENFQGQTASPDTSLGSCYEPFLVARKGQPHLAKPGRRNVFGFEPVAPQRKIHPTERPVELMDEIMDTFTYPNSVICVPFLGSGVTLRSAYRKNHTGYGWDLDNLCKERFLNAVYKDQMEMKNGSGG